MTSRKWTIDQLKNAVGHSRSIRQVLKTLGLKPASGNYSQLHKYLKEFSIDISHFKGQGWNKGTKGALNPKIPLKEILVSTSNYQSYKLKERLFSVNLKVRKCEECGWANRSIDGRIPVELDHINGDSQDNRLENLRILCPNCHSLKPTHRGRNKKHY